MMAPRQCPIILLVRVGRTEGKTFGCEEGKDELKSNLVLITFKNSVSTSKRTPRFTITKINMLKLFKEIIVVYLENHMNSINTLCSKTTELLLYRWYIQFPLGFKGLICETIPNTGNFHLFSANIAHIHKGKP
jgi:hypothetical protein